MEIVVRVREEIYLIYGRRIKNIITIYIYISYNRYRIIQHYRMQN